MCRLCETNPVYEFTNKRKLCKKCFINYFQKKVLYEIRKFSMVKKEDIVGYKKRNDFKGVVLEYILKFAVEKIGFQLVRLPNAKAKKIAIDSSIDSESCIILNCLIDGNVSDLKDNLPVKRDIIKPLYLFLDEEILLFAKIKNLKFKKTKEENNKINLFIEEFEKKHPEVKRAVVNSLLELYK